MVARLRSRPRVAFANNAMDPIETVAVNFDLANVGIANTTNQLLKRPVRHGACGPQNYGVSGAWSGGNAVHLTVAPPAARRSQQPSICRRPQTWERLHFPDWCLGAPVTATYSTGNISTPIPDLPP